MTRAALVLAAPLLMAACAPNGSKPSGPVDRNAMAFVGSFTPRQVERCREAWAFYLEAFERDERPVAWRSLTMVKGSEVRPGVGGEVRPGRHVFIGSDPEETCTAVYHELAHLLLMSEGGDGDPGHTDPRWVGWQARRQALIFALIDARIARDGRSGP